jgi:pyruvate dehydrogenase E2 component (dihydrolipoamide acetyltransferase)
MRQTIARRMTESKQQAPHFYVTVEIVMDAALGLREQLNKDLGEKVVSVNDLVLKAAAMALRTFLNLNTSFAGETVRRHPEIHMGFALALPEGLIVPVIRRCDQKGIAEIAREAEDLGERARQGKLRPEELQGGTFTVSNLGMFDVESFAAIINPPQTAILAVGSAQSRAIADGGAVRVAHVMKATLSADHRVTDGAEAARYLGEVKRLLQNPSLLA